MITLDAVHTLLGDFPATKKEVGHDVFDRISGWIEKEEIADAERAILDCFSEGILDARLICYYLYAQFLEQGIGAFPGAFALVTSLVEGHLDRLTPCQGAESHFQKGLGLFLNQVLKRFKYVERILKSGRSHPMVRPMTTQEFDGLLEIIAECKRVVSKRWDNSSLQEGILHVLKKLAEVRCLSISPPTHEEAPPQSETPQIVAEPRKEVVATSFASPQMEALLAKLEMFAALMEKNDLLKAALVSKDIAHLIATFDPTVYFPQLFSKYFSLLAKHVIPLSREWEKEQSLQWSYLDKLYKTDPEHFVVW